MDCLTWFMVRMDFSIKRAEHLLIYYTLMRGVDEVMSGRVTEIIKDFH